MSQRKYLFKVVVVGDSGVGKSTMIQRLMTGQFIPMKITIGTDLANYDVSINEETFVRLQIWDFAGEKRFRFFLPNYTQGADGCLLCYDITRLTSFEKLDEWYNIVIENAREPVFILVGGKYDLAEVKRSVDHEKAEKYQQERKMAHFFETSSKSGYNNKIMFKTLTYAIIEKKNQKLY